jgi:hypothetical protein
VRQKICSRPINRWFQVVLQDGIGADCSTKPSDRLQAQSLHHGKIDQLEA